MGLLSLHHRLGHKQAATYSHHIDIEEHTHTVIAYINKHINDVMVIEFITVQGNQLTGEVFKLLKAWNGLEP